MKKTLLAAAVALAATNVQAVELYKTDKSEVTFYGQLRGQLVINDGQDPDLNSGSSRAGVKVSHELTDSLDAFGTAEFSIRYYEDKDNGKSDMYMRKHFVGLKGDFGEVQFGKDLVIGEYVYGADYSYYYGATALVHGVLNGAFQDSAIRYTYKRGDFFVTAGYGLGEDDLNKEAIELYTGTKFGDFNTHIGGGIVTDAYSYGVEVEQTYVQATLEYIQEDHFTLGTTLGTTTLENKVTGDDETSIALSLAGQYQITPKTKLYGGYEMVRHDLDALDDSTNIYTGLEYKFNSWVRVYGEYAYQDGATLGFTDKNNNKIGAGSSADKANNFMAGFRVYW